MEDAAWGAHAPPRLTQPGFLPGVSEGEGGHALFPATSPTGAGQTLGAQKKLAGTPVFSSPQPHPLRLLGQTLHSQLLPGRRDPVSCGSKAWS